MRQLEGEYGIDDGPSLERLMQCKLSLNEKLDRVSTLDEEILALVDDDGIESEIEQADQFRERVHQAMFHLQHTIHAKDPSSGVPVSSRSASPTILTTYNSY